MSCYVETCQDKIIAICKDHEIFVYFCFFHYFEHKRQTNHTLDCINQEQSQIIIQSILNIEIRNCMIQMIKDTQEITTALKNSCNLSIMSLISANKNLKNLSEFKSMGFKREWITFIIREIEQNSIISDSSLVSVAPKKDELEIIESAEYNNINHELKDTDIAWLKWRNQIMKNMIKSQEIIKKYAEQKINAEKSIEEQYKNLIKTKRRRMKNLRKIEELTLELKNKNSVPIEKQKKIDRLIFELENQKLKAMKNLEDFWRYSTENNIIIKKEIELQIKKDRAWIKQQSKRIINLKELDELKTKLKVLKKIPIEKRSKIENESIQVTKMTLKLRKSSENRSKSREEVNIIIHKFNAKQLLKELKTLQNGYKYSASENIQLEPINYHGLSFVESSGLTREEKMKYVVKNYNFNKVEIEENFEELLFSNDENYSFICNCY